MRTALAIFIGAAIFLAMIGSFSKELGLDLLLPGFEAAKTTIVGVVFVLLAIGGLFLRFKKRRSDD